MPHANVTFQSPDIREAYNATLPSREERRANLDNLPVQCSAQCGKGVPRAQLKVCSRCKEARYCSPDCQTKHWRAGHKKECAPPGQSPRTLVIKLAERALAIPSITDYLTLHAVFTLELLDDPSNADRFAVHVQCQTGPADLQAYMNRLMSGKGRDPNAQVALSVVSFSRVPMEELSAGAKKTAADARDSITRKLMEDGAWVTFVLTEVKEKDKEGEGEVSVGPHYVPTGQEVAATLLVTNRLIEYARGKPKTIIRSAMIGDTEVEITPSVLKDGLNNAIRMDKENKMRLRAYPNSARKTR